MEQNKLDSTAKSHRTCANLVHDRITEVTATAITLTLVTVNTYYVSDTVIWIFHTLTHTLFKALCKVGTVFILMVVNYLLKVTQLAAECVFKPKF